MSARLDAFLGAAKNKYSSQKVQKRFKNRHRKNKEPQIERRRPESHEFGFEIDSGMNDFSSDEDMMDSFDMHTPSISTTTWMCDACTCVNSASCSQCSICATSRPKPSVGKPITLRSFLTTPQAMDLDDEPNSTNPFLQNAIHLSMQTFQAPPSFGTTTTTTTTTTTFISTAPRRVRQRGKRRSHSREGFNSYWSDAQTNAVNLVREEHYERNPDDMLRSFEPIGTKKQFKLNFGVPRAIVDRGGGQTRSVGTRQKRQKNEREERKAKKLYEHYKRIYVRDEDWIPEKLEVSRIIRLLYSYVPGELRQRKKFDGKGYVDCQACYAVNFEEKENKDCEILIPHCGHRTVCSDCFGNYLRIRIEDEDIVPWLPCPMPDCKTCVPPDLLIRYLSLENLYHFAAVFLRQHLKRNSNWVSCETDDCEFGFVRPQACDEEIAVCEACGTEQEFLSDPKEDDGLSQMIASGVMRLCPKCEWPTMKDYGMCNVMQCGQCGIWWNWRSRDFGNSSAEVKQRARMRGTMWEPGELQYQWDLQRTNLPAFKELLARNGIKYNPNYVRGSG